MKIKDAFIEVLKGKKIELNHMNKVEMDSRLVGEGDVFFAIGGGNQFVNSTIEKGAALVIYDDPKVKTEDKKAILVEDTIKTMQNIAKKYREFLDVKVIGITGTNGKTSTKDIVYSILCEKYLGIKSQGNYNNHIGLPYTILQIKETDEFAVLEMGMSSFGEIDLLCEISGIDYGIITNIGESHLEFLKTVENVFKAKGEMLKYLTKDSIFIFGDDDYLSKVDGIKVGFGPKNEFVIGEVQESEDGVEFNLEKETYYLPINGYYNAINAALSVAVGKTFEMTYEEIKKGLTRASLSSMRYEKTIIQNKLYINDAYNADPLSMKSALISFDKLYNTTYKIAILGDMLELGKDSKKYHRDLEKSILETRVDEVFLYGEEMKELKEVFYNSSKVTHFVEKEEIIKRIDRLKTEATILLKGSRGMKLEEIIK